MVRELRMVGKVAAADVIDPETGEVLLQCNEEVSEDVLDRLREHKISTFKVLFIDNLNVGSYLRDTLLADAWGYASDVDSRTVDTHVRRVRRKLGPHAERIETVIGVGYRLRS